MFRATDSPAFDHSRRNSAAMSTISQTPSTRPILAPASPMTSTVNLGLAPPTAPFNARPGSPAGSTHSLTVNYLPSKFSHMMVSRRRGYESKDDGGPVGMVPRGGGVAAFRANAARMPGEQDEDYDGVDLRPGQLLPNRKARWTRFKAILFVANTALFLYSLCALVFTLLTYFHTLKDAPILLVANQTELALSTLAASVALFTALLGFPGILLNNRPFLAVYTLLLWVSFGLLVVPGYITYKRVTLNIDGKINQQWSQELGAQGRLTIQNQLGCCGYFSPFIEATVSSTCYARSTLPGCKEAYLAFQKKALTRWYTVSFGLVPVNIAIIFAALLCSNHVTYRFGKGMMPKAYRLSREAMAVIVEKYAAQLADQYGPDAAQHILSASQSGSNSASTANLLAPHSRSPFGGSPGGSPAESAADLTAMPFEQHARGGSGYGGSGGQSHAKYDSLSGAGERI